MHHSLCTENVARLLNNLKLKGIAVKDYSEYLGLQWHSIQVRIPLAAR